MLSSFSDLKTLLASRDVPMISDDERQAVEIPTFIRGEAHSAIILWDPRATLLQVIQPLAIEVLPDMEGRMADALVRINHQLALPGFGYDHDRNVAYYRWVVPRELDGSLGEESLDKAIRTVLQTCRDFLPGLRAVASGQTPSSEVIPFSAKILEEERGQGLAGAEKNESP